MHWGTKWDKDDLISRRAQDSAWLWRLDSDLPETWPPGAGWVWKAWVAAAGESAVNMWLEVPGGRGSPHGCSDLGRSGQTPAAGDSGASTPTSWSTTSAALTALSTSRPSASRS